MKPNFKLTPSWYVPTEKFTEKQLMYVKLVTSTFNMFNQLSQPIPYEPTVYQVEFHANSLNILLEEAKNILWLKARGISFTYGSITELMMSAITFEDQVFPVIAQREQNSKDIVKTGWRLLQKANNRKLHKQFELKGNGSELVNHETGSVIRAYPSNAASESIRSLRLIRYMLDEFAFQTRDKELFTAATHCTQGDLGQGIIGSTPKGRRNYFFDLCNKPVGFKMFRLPVFDPSKFNPAIKPSLQNLQPVAGWISLNVLDEDWGRDRIGFMQENMNDFLDDSTSLFPYALIMRRVNRVLKNLCPDMEKHPDLVYNTNNPIILGIDVAETSDYTAIVAFEVMPIGDKQVLVQRFLKTIRNISLPKQTEYVRRVIEFFPSMVKCRIDMTGIGQHMFETLYEEYGAVIKGIDFRRRIKTAEKGVSTKIRDYMFTNLLNLMESEPQQIALMDVPLQTRHLGSIDRSFVIAKDAEEGHGDILVAISLAAMQLNYKARNSSRMYTGSSSLDSKKHDIVRDGVQKLKSNVTPEEIQENYDNTRWEDHIEDLRKGAKKRKRL